MTKSYKCVWFLFFIWCFTAHVKTFEDISTHASTDSRLCILTASKICCILYGSMLKQVEDHRFLFLIFFWHDVNATYVILTGCRVHTRLVIWGKLLFRFLHVSTSEADGWISRVSCCAYALVLQFCALQQFHTDIDPLAHQCKVTSIWGGWSSSGFSFFFFF